MKRRLAVMALFILLFFRGSAQYMWLQPSIHHFYWPTVKTGEKVLLYFDDVNRPLIIYINNKVAGVHGGSYGHSSLDITAEIKQGDNEVIIVGEGNSDAWEKTWIDTTPSPRR